MRTPDGHLIAREYLKHPGAVGVIALDDHDRVALVRQYRHPVRHRLIEPPAGLLDVGGEDYLQAIQRELAEEVVWLLEAGPSWSTSSPRRESSASHCASISPATWRRSTTRRFHPRGRGGTHGHRLGVARRPRGGNPRWPPQPDRCLRCARCLDGTGAGRFHEPAPRQCRLARA